jgi:protein phosphatase methylesterase 1
VALAVIDVVEGSAMAALTLMTHFLRNRPQHFPSYERAIRWCVESGMTKNKRAARISMPSQICPGSSEKDFHWRINLTKTQPHWVGWFTDISKKFLECQPAKVLILAHVDRLDKELLVGQMRGMFQLEVLPKVGHAVHEDNPERVAAIFVTIYRKYKPILRL